MDSVVHATPKRKKTSRKREETKNQTKPMISKVTTLSTRKAASLIGDSQTFILSILHGDLHLKPYKYQEWHKLEYHDYERRVNFAKWIQQPNSL